MKVDVAGNLFATGPGGVLVLAPDGTHLGTIATGEATANCAWGDDGSTLYITADMYLARIRLSTRGKIPGR
jgi:gluconolactonase